MAKTPRSEFRNLEHGQWSHIEFLDSHSVLPHYDATGATGKWVCYTCKQGIKLNVAFQHRQSPLDT